MAPLIHFPTHGFCCMHLGKNFSKGASNTPGGCLFFFACFLELGGLEGEVELDELQLEVEFEFGVGKDLAVFYTLNPDYCCAA